MSPNGKKVVIVGGGIAGLCAAVYAQQCGYQAEVFEMHDMAGGLAVNWPRGGYTFENCLHWLYGSNPASPMHAHWLEVCDLDRLKFIDHAEFGRFEAPTGESLTVYTNIDRLESEFLRHAPRDAAAIRRFTADLRALAKFKMPNPAATPIANLLALARDISSLPLLRRLANTSCRQYAESFTDPLLRSFFGDGDMGQLSAVALFFSLAWMHQHDAAYAIGGSQALIRLIEEKLIRLGGHLHLKSKVDRILVDDGQAFGIQLVGGDTIAADWVISAADGHATLYNLLGGRYLSNAAKKTYTTLQTFPSYLQVSLGIARDLSDQPPIATRLLRTPLHLDPGTPLGQVSFRFFNFDPTFAPAGKTAITCFLPTRNHRYWTQLRQSDPAAYHAEKHRVAEAVIAILEQKIPGIHTAIEVVDVATPATVIRYTGNWKGSMEGWFLSPGSRFRSLPNTLPGLGHFLMVGQWVMPGGGLPSGPMTARPAIQTMCKKDHVRFLPHPHPADLLLHPV
ncbi:MAG TPA: NAD(P)/FAD-dependent oxidoreductase [Acidobacteriaceae bacterium]|jgi:phytoene dehydrogenase-like protein|nr:NAD(P)/FAD-dependent oxidoreductase [Acidobacteriaceae bacterium]